MENGCGGCCWGSGELTCFLSYSASAKLENWVLWVAIKTVVICEALKEKHNSGPNFSAVLNQLEWKWPWHKLSNSYMCPCFVSFCYKKNGSSCICCISSIFLLVPLQSAITSFVPSLKAQFTISVVVWPGSGFQPLKCCRQFVSTWNRYMTIKMADCAPTACQVHLTRPQMALMFTQEGTDDLHADTLSLEAGF